MDLKLFRRIERHHLLSLLPVEDPNQLSAVLYQTSLSRVVSFGDRAVEGYLLSTSFLHGPEENYFLLILYKGPGVLYLYHTEETFLDFDTAYQQLHFLVRNYPLFGLSSRYRIG